VSSQDTRHVLIVDDNLELADNIAEFLSMCGFVAEVACRAEEALARPPSGRQRTVVADFRLPGINGLAMIKAMHGTGARVHAIVISADIDDAVVADVRAAGAAFLPKPVSFDALHDFVTQAPW